MFKLTCPRLLSKCYHPLRFDSDLTLSRFYAPWCGHCQRLQPEYTRAAKNLEGLANVVAVNCDEEDNKPFCGQMRIQGFPTLKTVKVTGIIGKPIVQDYQGPRTASDIVEATKKLIPNYVTRLDTKEFEGWLAKENSTAKAILFSDKGVTSALIKSLANDYFGNMIVAQVRDKEIDITKVFGVTKFPSLVVLPGGDETAVMYDGPMRKPAMSNFLGQYAKARALPEKASTKDKKDKTKTKSKESKPDNKAGRQKPLPG